MDQRSDGQPSATPNVPAPASSPPAPARQSLEGSVKETIESILVAFILAFIFRAFVVEAFVIPTGSMAPTLLGAHMHFRCPDCGYRFDVNYQGTDSGDDINIPKSAGESRVFAIYCPNCGFRLPRVDPNDPANDATNPDVRYGDRILVLKYLYLFQEPKRWDVVVFKSPSDPSRYDYTQNYIKRLVGKPGESIMALDGDVYVGQGDDLNSFKVQSKPRKVQQALWRIVYDNDYHPRSLERIVTSPSGDVSGHDPAWEQPWKQTSGQSGWTIGDGSPGHRDFTFSNPSGAAALSFDPAVNPRKMALTDWLAYDITDTQDPREDDTYRSRSYVPDANVSDVKLQFFYQRNEGAGPLRIQLTKLEHTFEAQIARDRAVLLMDDKTIAGPIELPSHSEPMQIEMSNVDYKVTLRIDDRDLLTTSERNYRPDLPMLMDAFRANRKLPPPTIRIIGESQACVLSHVSLWRDVYYLNRAKGGRPLPWGTPDEFPKHLTRLGKDEYFVMGDNSYVSADARYWEQPIDLPSEDLHVQAGRVPRRFMLGKAFFVYWPAGYRPISSAPALVPDFGDMRFIH